MAKLPALKPKEVAKVLEKAGFCFVRQKGSHCIYLKGETSIVIPWHSNDLKTGTLRSIIHYSGMTIKEFLRFKNN